MFWGVPQKENSHKCLICRNLTSLNTHFPNPVAIMSKSQTTENQIITPYNSQRTESLKNFESEIYWW